ncbi:MaoC family dehydratase N-terminal domain-containing protein [bacterium]|jgi:3-hydroxybutyryl-CoA dehydratase|nr:MaoC family dehydratase N-terminal domain-containing protein [bacterium]
MPAQSDEPLTFDDVAVGDTWISPARTITEADVVQFACLTGDFNPLHVDHEFARSTPFGQPIAHGLLGLSYVAGLGSHAPRMATLSFLKILEWNFLKPIFFGDTVHVRTEILAMEPKARGRRGEIIWQRELVNQTGDVVQMGRTLTLVAGRGKVSED